VPARSTRRRVIACAKALVILLAILWSAFPIFLVVSSSFKRTSDIFSVPLKLFFKPTTENYVGLWRDWSVFFHGLFNSLVITLGATLLTIIGSALAGWTFSRCPGRYFTGSAFALIILRLLPPIVITLPLFPIANVLGLNDTHILLIALYATFFVSLGAWIMKAFFNQVPRELEEAAANDGASFRQILLHITMPLGVPGMIAAAVFVFIFSWNDYLFAFIFTTSRAKTAPVILSEIMGSATGVDWGVLFAAASIQLLPIVVFVIFLQKYLMAGLTAGSMKG
jgi:multiple sugar transport system permease protein